LKHILHESTNHCDESSWPSGLGPRSIELSVMNYIGGTTAVVVAAFSVYRFVTGDYSGGLTNAIIVLMLASALVLGRFRRYARYALILFGIVSTAACLMSALLVSTNGLLWCYLVLWVNFLLLPRWLAVTLNAALIVTLGVQVELFESMLQQVSWLAVAVLISGFGLVFTGQLRRQRRQLSHLATLDPLTGAGNRRLMQHHLEATIAEHRRNDGESTLMVLDLDHFKKINDNHGHEAGDRALERFAASVSAALRTEDGLYRMGGEEFVVLLRGMNARTPSTALPDLHRRLSGTVEGPEGPLRFSAGAAVLKPEEGWSKWLARADNALYRAKKAGRDCVIIDDG